MMDPRNAMQRSNSKKRKLLTCFKPVAVTMEEEEEAMLSPTTKDRKNKKDMWKALGAALKGTSLTRKISRKKANKAKTARSKDDDDDDKLSSSSLLCKTSTPRTTSNVSSNSGSSSSPLSSSSSSRSSPLSSVASRSFSSSPELAYSPCNRSGVIMAKHHRQINNVENNNNNNSRKGCCSSNKARLMLIIGLLLMIMWGRCLAIVYTSVWLYMVRPVRRRPCNKELQYWARYQRKIMEGLLERSNSRVSPASSSSMRRS